jgi:hypothetical protein
MSTMKDRLNALTKEQQRQLFYAFEHEFDQYVELPDGKFIGVNVQYIKNFKVLEQIGNWAYGTIVKQETKAAPVDTGSQQSEEIP